MKQIPVPEFYWLWQNCSFWKNFLNVLSQHSIFPLWLPAITALSGTRIVLCFSTIFQLNDNGMRSIVIFGLNLAWTNFPHWITHLKITKPNSEGLNRPVIFTDIWHEIAWLKRGPKDAFMSNGQNMSSFWPAIFAGAVKRLHKSVRWPGGFCFAGGACVFVHLVCVVTAVTRNFLYRWRRCRKTVEELPLTVTMMLLTYKRYVDLRIGSGTGTLNWLQNSWERDFQRSC